ncbi:hypothetical protein C943_03272 [Mariniradius saccharolyticus AK6]|uniref:DNA primase n=1 Tax=Mariniradius saccharolyticus AK6 TaxID=1239962 RepID=M7XAX7_9BACT|nr:hypothetical protein [Mariniradius saccharolyticus]EMS34585.1 hypothetical protein C943_03272 [Mariniradius saccharolyticus AK6]
MFIDQQRLLDETDGGLKIILYYYPQAAVAIDNHRKKFKLRDTEKTASATLKRLPDGTYVVTDFGGDQKPKNGIHICMEEEALEFKDALQVLGSRYGISGEDNSFELLKPLISKRPAETNENEGEWFFEVREGFTELEIKTVLAEKAIPMKSTPAGKIIDEDKIQKVFRKYNFYSLISYSIVKNREVITIAATDTYPIMMWDEGKFKKIYQPLSPDKSRRFMYYGKRDAEFLHGYEACLQAHAKLNEGGEDIDTDTGEIKNSKENKLPEIIYCSGGSDGMNLAMIGYEVVWGNSETATLSKKQFNALAKLADRVMNMPDIDTTGKKEAHRLAMEHLELYTIVLPEELKDKPDRRGNPSKDVRDYLKWHGPWDFKNLVATALPYQFWEAYYTETKSGSIKKAYNVKNTRMYNFLGKNGFYRLQSDNDKTGWIYIKVTHNIVQEIKANEVKSYINDFFRDRYMDEELRDTFYRSTQVNESSMSNLPLVDIDFTDYDKHTQYFFFRNRTVEVRANSIRDYKLGEIDKFVWEEEVIKHQFKLQEPHFRTSKRADGSLDIEVLKHDNIFFNFLINTARVHWRKELEEAFEGASALEEAEYFKKHQWDIAGPNLDEGEIREQKNHLLNRIYTIGYLLHRYKDPSRPWAVFAMDHRIGGDGESHGGSGKSLAYKAVRLFMKAVSLDGRNPKLTDDQFIYSNVTKHTDLILVDDCNQYLNFQFFFAPLTGDLTVNPKQTQRYEIPFKDVPKFVLTSNFVVRNLDSSTERRLIYSVFSDYYHENSNNFYKQARQPKDDFGKNILGNEFTQDEWNDFYNFMLQCCQFYMQHEKINPPMNNVVQRNLISIMTEPFLEWAEVYFHEENNGLNNLVVKADAFEDYKKYAKVTWQMQKFSKALKAFCELKGYVLDPEDLKNSDKRIIRKVTRPDGSSKSMEMIFIKTHGHSIPETAAAPEVQPPGGTFDWESHMNEEDLEAKF